MHGGATAPAEEGDSAKGDCSRAGIFFSSGDVGSLGASVMGDFYGTPERDSAPDTDASAAADALYATLVISSCSFKSYMYLS
jgi:hypothetical protein